MKYAGLLLCHHYRSLIGVPEDSRIRQADVKDELLVQRQLLLFAAEMKMRKILMISISISTSNYIVIICIITTMLSSFQ